MMHIKKIDHLVITTTDIEACLTFYQAIGFTCRCISGRYELFAGDFKINVHCKGKELYPHAAYVQCGSADICFEVEQIEKVKEHLEKQAIQIDEGIVERTGVKGAMKSIYIRDPDGNLLEFSSYSI